MLTRTVSEKEAQLKKRMAMPSDKDILFRKVQDIFQKSNSIAQFETLLKKEGIQTYSRVGKLTGVYYGKRRFRFKQSLGIDPKLLLLKDRTLDRASSLDSISEKTKDKDVEREL